MVGWDVDLFDDFFDPNAEWRMGRPVRWEKARICACMNAYSGVAAPHCEFCWGTGRCFADGVDITVGVSGYDKKRAPWKEFGDVPVGSLLVTIPVNQVINGRKCRLSMYDEIGDLDRITLLDDVERREIPLVKGKDDGVQFTVVEVERIRTTSDDNCELEWTTGEHYVLQGNRIIWMTGPIDGTAYVLEAKIHPTYYVFDARVMHRNHSGVELPKKIMMVPAELHDRNRRVGKGTGP
jgi:hypothetical protein